MTAEVKATGTAAWAAHCPRCDEPMVKGDPIVLLRVGEVSAWVHASHVPPATSRHALLRCPMCLASLPEPPSRRYSTPAPLRCIGKGCGWKDDR